MWVSEIDAHDQFAGKDLGYIQVACLKQVRAAPSGCNCRLVRLVFVRFGV